MVPTLLAVGLAVAFVLLRSDLSDEQARVAELEQDLASVEAQLVEQKDTNQEVSLALDETESALATTAADLEDSRTLQSETLEELHRAEDELVALEGTLAETQGDLQTQQQRTTLQAGQIGTLKSCLSGVYDALYWASYEYWSLAGSALNSVNAVCTRANALFN